MIERVKLNFVNAQEQHKNHPGTFYAPSVSDVEDLQPGDFVKVSIEGERFWVIISIIKDGCISGTVDNNLLFTNKHGYKDKDPIAFRTKNILQILKKDDI